MTALGQILAGARVPASVLQGVAPLSAYKGVSQSVTSSTVLQNDDALFLPVPANSTFIMLGLVSFSGAANGSGDLKGQFTVPSGGSGLIEAAGFGLTGAGPLNGNPVRVAGVTFVAGGNGGSAAPLLLLASFQIGSTQGTIQFQWAQNTSSATATTVGAGSFLAAWQVQ